MPTNLKIEMSLLNKDAKVPTKTYESPACWDLYASRDTTIASSGGRNWVRCGFKTALPKGYYARIYGRGGYSKDNQILLGAGVIDEDFRGEWQVLVFNFSPYPLKIAKGTKFAQFALCKKYDAEIDATVGKELPGTERGEKGFGSSGN